VPEKTSVGLVYLGSFNTDYCRNVEIIPQKINLKEKKFVKEIIESFEIFRNILFFKMENYLTDRC
jgi:hypothetical protein